MYKTSFSILATLLVLSLGAFAQNTPVPPDNFPATVGGAYQVQYVANTNLGASIINIVNAGTEGAYNGSDNPIGDSRTGNVCVNLYVFDPCEEEIACCTCPTTPNSLNSVSIASLVANPTHPPSCGAAGGPGRTSFVIKLLATLPVGFPTAGIGAGCNAGAPAGVGNSLPMTVGVAGASAMGIKAWRTTVHTGAGNQTVATTENAFAPAILVFSEREKLVSRCRFSQQNLSGIGVCNGCVTGGLAAGPR